jgi:hypothetical protein
MRTNDNPTTRHFNEGYFRYSVAANAWKTGMMRLDSL